MSDLTLVSHRLCPYVQRAAIVLAEKGRAFERRDVDLANKPAWFLELSPLGKTPLLLTDGHALFESAVICEYLDETVAPRLLPQDAIERARQRGWIEFGSQVLNRIAAFYNAADETALAHEHAALRGQFERLEAQLGDGPYFAGANFGLVDATFGPVFRYFDVFEQVIDFAELDRMPRLRAWRAALAARDSVRTAVPADYPQWLRQFLRARPSALAARYAALEAPVA
jgi:glutathione S-transferase